MIAERGTSRIDEYIHPSRSAASDAQLEDNISLHDKNSSDAEFGHANPDLIKARVDRHFVIPLTLCLASIALSKGNFRSASQLDSSEAYLFVVSIVTGICNGFILTTVPVVKWLTVSIILWGITTMCIAATETPGALLATRIITAILEGTIIPCFFIICGYWYTRYEQASRFLVWYCGIVIGESAGIFLDCVFRKLRGHHLNDWKAECLVAGGVAVVVGLACIGLLLEKAASFLTQADKLALDQHISSGESRSVSKVSTEPNIFAAFVDSKVWGFVLMAGISRVALEGAAVTADTSTAGTSTAGEQGSYNATFVVILLAVGSGLGYTGAHRAWVMTLASIGLVGSTIFWFCEYPGGAYLALFGSATSPIIFHWAAFTVEGKQKRAVVFSLLAITFSFGDFLEVPLSNISDEEVVLFILPYAVLGTLSALPSLCHYLTRRIKGTTQNAQEPNNPV